MENNFFFSYSQHTFVKGIKDSNKTFLKSQVREDIGTMYLFLIDRGGVVCQNTRSDDHNTVPRSTCYAGLLVV